MKQNELVEKLTYAGFFIKYGVFNNLFDEQPFVCGVFDNYWLCDLVVTDDGFALITDFDFDIVLAFLDKQEKIVRDPQISIDLKDICGGFKYGD
jgi:hypothetical protein